MNNRINTLFVLTGLLATTAVAQTSFEVGHLIENQLVGSARYVGMGGAMGAFGSDLSTIEKNPAGIATYRSSAVELSLSALWGNSKIPGEMNRNQEGAPLVAFNNTGFVSNLRTGLNDAVNFAFSYKRTKSFDRYTEYNTLLTGKPYDLVIDNPDGTQTTIISPNERQCFNNKESGSIHSFDFNISRAIDNRFFFGLTLGVNTVDYLSNAVFTSDYPDYKKQVIDQDNNTAEYPLIRTDYDVAHRMRGAGISFGMGTIIRPIQESSWRVGLSVKTPTMYNLTSDYNYKLYNYQLTDYPGGDAQNLYSKYKIYTPWTINASTGITIGTFMALGAEFEYQNCKHSNIYVGGSKMNGQCGTDLKQMYTFRIGAEFNAGNVSLRCGYNYISPMFQDNAMKAFVDNSAFNENRLDWFSDLLKQSNVMTLGIGISGGKIFKSGYLDLAYMHQWDHRSISLKEDDSATYSEPYTDYTANRNNITLAIGWVF